MISPNLVFCIGASAGGVQAIQRLLSGIPKGFAAPILVTQHLPENSNLDIELIYSAKFEGRVSEAIDKTPVLSGNAYFAPPAYHMLVESDRHLSLSQEEPVHYARPSIDVLFESAAFSLGSHVCGVLLTGANSDGAQGLLAIQKYGGWTIVQDPADAEVPFMPQAALDLFTPDFTLPLDQIPAKLVELSRKALK